MRTAPSQAVATPRDHHTRGVHLLWRTAAEATKAAGGLRPTGVVLNTYISLHDPS